MGLIHRFFQILLHIRIKYEILVQKYFRVMLVCVIIVVIVIIFYRSYQESLRRQAIEKEWRRKQQIAREEEQHKQEEEKKRKQREREEAKLQQEAERLRKQREREEARLRKEPPFIQEGQDNCIKIYPDEIETLHYIISNATDWNAYWRSGEIDLMIEPTVNSYYSYGAELIYTIIASEYKPDKYTLCIEASNPNSTIYKEITLNILSYEEKERKKFYWVRQLSESTLKDYVTDDFKQMIGVNSEFDVEIHNQNMNKEIIFDPLFQYVARSVVRLGFAYIWFIQKEFGVSHYRALELLYQLEKTGIIKGPDNTVIVKDIDSLNDIFKKLNLPSIERETDEERKKRIKEEIALKLRYEQERRKIEKEVWQEMRKNNELDKFGVRPTIPKSVVDAVYRKCGGKCAYCGSDFDLQIDHIIPISKGGSSTIDNLQLLCSVCNNKKSNKIG
ncbi:HNH endonuclease [Alistipes putredinis]|uniref:HNH endonuclease n=1 Tax=Alistipes putredinis TaxID=28117 RepID=UPI003AB6560B